MNEKWKKRKRSMRRRPEIKLKASMSSKEPKDNDFPALIEEHLRKVTEAQTMYAFWEW